jgi:hypothetical protein
MNEDQLKKWVSHQKDFNVFAFLKEHTIGCIEIWKVKKTKIYAPSSETFEPFLKETMDFEWDCKNSALIFEKTFFVTEWCPGNYLIEIGLIDLSSTQFISSERTWLVHNNEEETVTFNYKMRF